MKTCKQCGLLKKVSEFNKHSTSKDRLSYVCKECHKENNKKWYSRSGRNKHLLNTYGVTQESYSHMYKVQKGCCAICGVEEKNTHLKRLYVDHSHTTGKIRELLCHNCNSSLGQLKESIDTLKKMINYIEKHDEQN